MLNPAYKLEVALLEGIDSIELRKCHRAIRQARVFGVLYGAQSPPGC
jgi:hypothetical protein